MLGRKGVGDARGLTPGPPIAPHARVTLADVAHACGVSKATVSLVVRESPRIGEKTTLKVRSAMTELGYVYNRNAAQIRSGVSKTVGLIVPNLTNPFLARVAAGVNDALDRMQRVVLIGNSHDDPKKQAKILDQMREHGVDGIIVCPASGTDRDALEAFAKLGPPLMQILRRVPSFRCDYVSADYDEVISLAFDHLIERGFQRPIYVGSENDHSAETDREACFIKTCRQHGMDVEIVRSSVSRRGAYHVVKALLQRPRRPDALMFYSDIMALGALRAARELELVAGRDVGFVGCDNLEDGEFSFPSLTTIAIDAHQIGVKTVDMLFGRIAVPASSRQTVTFGAELVARCSSAGNAR